MEKIQAIPQYRFIVNVKLILVLVLFSTASLNAQYHDFRSWWNIDLSKDISDDLEASITFSERFDQNSLRFDRSLATIGLQYDIHENIEVEAAYRYYLVNAMEGGFESRYRMHGSVIFSKTFDAFKIALRERLHYGFDDFSHINSYYENRLISRSRLKGSYDIFGTPISIYTSYEMWLDVFSLSQAHLIGHRIRSGLVYNINHRSKINLSYLHEIEVNTRNPLTSHILYTAYYYKF